MPPASVTIRPIAFGSADYAAELDLRRAVLRTPLGLALSAADVMGEEAQLHWGAFDTTGALVGCVVLQSLGPEVDRLRQMAVHPAWQGRGIGRRLVAAAEACAKRRGIGNIILHARATAAGFYVRLGYRVTSPAFIEVGIPHVTMDKAL